MKNMMSPSGMGFGIQRLMRPEADQQKPQVGIQSLSLWEGNAISALVLAGKNAGLPAA
jgi:hypothetical protein